ncbi:GtrA family protein [Methylomagnum sp.]
MGLPIKQLFRYLISGSVAATAHLLTLTILVERFDVVPLTASILGFCVAVVFNYSLQYHWTFAAHGSHAIIFSRYIGVTLAMLGINTLLFWIFQVRFSLPYLLAQVLATGIIVILNFNINRNFTFKLHGQRAS